MFARQRVGLAHTLQIEVILAERISVSGSRGVVRLKVVSSSMGCIMDAQTVVGRVSIERHSPALKHVTVIGGQDVDWHIETHAVGGDVFPRP